MIVSKLIKIKKIESILNKSRRSLSVLNIYKKPILKNELFSLTKIQKRYESTEIISPSSSTVSNQMGFIAESPLTRVFEDVLCQVHDVLDVNWFTSIFLAAFAFRLFVCFPVKSKK